MAFSWLKVPISQLQVGPIWDLSPDYCENNREISLTALLRTPPSLLLSAAESAGALGRRLASDKWRGANYSKHSKHFTSSFHFRKNEQYEGEGIMLNQFPVQNENKACCFTLKLSLTPTLTIKISYGKIFREFLYYQFNQYIQNQPTMYFLLFSSYTAFLKRIHNNQIELFREFIFTFVRYTRLSLREESDSRDTAAWWRSCAH